MSIARRSFLALCGAGIAGAAALWAPLIWRSDVDHVASTVRKSIPDLRMDPAELQAFAEEFVADYKSPGYRRDVILVGARVVDGMPEGLAAAVLPDGVTSRIQRLEEEIMSSFFLGTDFLETQDDPAREVTFLYIPDPYVVGCANMLARFDA